MFKDTIEMRQRGESWSRHESFPTSSGPAMRWKAWFRASKKAYRVDKDMKKTPAAVLGSRYERGLPSYRRCQTSQGDKSRCKITRKGHVLASLTSRGGLVACKDCDDPSEAGIYYDIWPCHYQMSNFHIDAEIIYSVPNDASSELLNADHLTDNLVLVDRGSTPIVEIVRTVERSSPGALGIIIVDDGSCDDNFQCTKGSRKAGEGFGAADDWQNWVGLNTPCFLVTKDTGKSLKSFMPLHKVNVVNLGEQMVCEEDFK
eukprot:g2183.t1